MQYDFSETVTLGGELYHQTAQEQGGVSNAGFNVGGVVNFNDENHFLFSVGHAMTGPSYFTAYIGYQLTL